MKPVIISAPVTLFADVISYRSIGPIAFSRANITETPDGRLFCFHFTSDGFCIDNGESIDQTSRGREIHLARGQANSLRSDTGCRVVSEPTSIRRQLPAKVSRSG